jgi:serine/threonine protein kinase
MVHRDLKPANILVTRTGAVKVIDFGLAKAIERNPDQGWKPTIGLPETRAGTILGSVGYMSPEQVRGRSAGSPSDIFSIGAVLYEMLSGRRAFEEETPVDTMSAICIRL